MEDEDTATGMVNVEILVENDMSTVITTTLRQARTSDKGMRCQLSEYGGKWAGSETRQVHIDMEAQWACGARASETQMIISKPIGSRCRTLTKSGRQSALLYVL